MKAFEPPQPEPGVEVLTAEEARHVMEIDKGDALCNMANCRFHRLRGPSAEALQAAIRRMQALK